MPVAIAGLLAHNRIQGLAARAETSIDPLDAVELRDAIEKRFCGGFLLISRSELVAAAPSLGTCPASRSHFIAVSQLTHSLLPPLPFFQSCEQ